MTPPPNVIFVPAAADGWVQLVSATCTSSTSNHYATHTNIVGDPEWDGRSPTLAFYFSVSALGADRIEFFFANDTDRDTAQAAYASWRITGTDGMDEIATVTTSSFSRLRFSISLDFSAGETYTIEGQP